MKIEYLTFNFIILLSPLLSYLFFPKIIYPLDNISLISILIAAFIFILHDIFANNNWWRFNNKFILGVRILNLPIEEIMFFFTVGFACLTIWLNLKTVNLKIEFNLFPLFLLIGLYYLFLAIKSKKAYAQSMTIFYIVLIITDISSKINLALDNFFILYLGIILFLTLIFNYYLTKRPVVLYNKEFLSGKKILTIPVEDFLYGINFIYLTTIIYEFFSNSAIF
ncbi:MAG: hypothetical protein KatS3mg090_0435 [Patescibacteria group bacterium]|nr:MAG: hypothetical protein KatS3mg090_0435 [Patescibacteria group bacterium]